MMFSSLIGVCHHAACQYNLSLYLLYYYYCHLYLNLGTWAIFYLFLVHWKFPLMGFYILSWVTTAYLSCSRSSTVNLESARYKSRHFPPLIIPRVHRAYSWPGPLLFFRFPFPYPPRVFCRTQTKWICLLFAGLGRQIDTLKCACWITCL